MTLVTNDTSRAVRIMIVSDAPSCGVILTKLEVSFTIAIFFNNTCDWFQKSISIWKLDGDKISPRDLYHKTFYSGN
jgi:hypothetical protein